MSGRVELWFDFSCPYAYLGSTQIEAVAARAGAELLLRPMLLGGVFRVWEMPQHLAAASGELRTRYRLADLARQARRFGVPLETPAAHPMRTVEALRAFLVAPSRRLFHALFQAYWVRGLELSDRGVLARVLDEVGLDSAAVLARAGSEEVKRSLAWSTGRAVELGIFGAPSFLVGADLVFGQDQLPEVEWLLGASPPARPTPGLAAELFVSLDCPDSYVLLERLDGAASAVTLVDGAALRAADPPLLNPAKARYLVADRFRAARRAEAPITWPRTAPSLALAERLAGGDLVRAALRRIWRDGVGDPTDLGPLPPPDPGRLEVATRRALALGAFDTPSAVVDGELYVGRVHVERALGL